MSDRNPLADLPDFFAAANCMGLDPDLMFPGRGDSQAAAKAVCADCSIRQRCLDYALENGEYWGVWGGTSERERRRLRRGGRRIVHGRNTTYINDNCRCDLCRQAHAEAARKARSA